VVFDVILLERAFHPSLYHVTIEPKRMSKRGSTAEERHSTLPTRRECRTGRLKGDRVGTQQLPITESAANRKVDPKLTCSLRVVTVTVPAYSAPRPVVLCVVTVPGMLGVNEVVSVLTCQWSS
jgi:hypothetical protein